MRFARLMLLSVVLTTAASANGDDATVTDLAPFEATYQVKRNGKEIGEATLRLEKLSNERVRYHLSTQGTRGLARWLAVQLDETTEAEWHEGRLRPVSYSYREKMRMRQRDRFAEFDWSSGTATGSNKGDEWRADIHEGVVDSRLLELILAQDVFDNDGARALEYDVLRKGRIRPYLFRVRQRETVPGPDGDPLSAHVVERVDNRRDRQVRLWLSESLGPAPVRASYADDDESLELNLVQFRQADGTSLSSL